MGSHSHSAVEDLHGFTRQVYVQFLVDQPYRQAAIRLVAASVLLLAVIRIRAFVRASIERPSAWDAERAGESRWVPPSSMNVQFEHFHDEIRLAEPG